MLPVPERNRGAELLRLSAMSSVKPPPSAHALGAAQLVAWGATYYAIPPLLPGISSELAVSVPSLTLAITVGLILNAFLSLAVAAWIHRRGARVPMVTGSIVATGALIALASSGGGATAFGALAMLGAAHAALLYEPAFAAVSAQTRDPIARTRAIQIVTFWGGWAALWALPAASLLGELVGWRTTLIALAVLLAVQTLRVHGRLPATTITTTIARLRGPRVSRRLALAFALGAFATTAIVINGLLLLAERRIDLATASIVFALLAPVQVVGRLWFMRRNGQLSRHDGSIPFVLISLGILALLAAPRSYALALFILLFGAGAGLLTTMRAAVVVVRTSPEFVARQLGALSFTSSLARAFAPVASSALYLHIGYEWSLITFALMALLAAVLVATTARRGAAPARP